MCNFDWQTIATCVLAVLALASFPAQIYFAQKQRGDSRKDLQVRITMQCLQRFDSDRMLHARHSLAHALRYASQSPQSGGAEYQRVLDFFEDLGALFADDLLHERMTRNTFVYFASGWWFACKPHVERLRKLHGEAASAFTQFERLGTAMRPNGMTAVEVADFLNREAGGRRPET